MTARSPPVTRKKSAALRVYEDFPASPSEPTRNVPHTATNPESEPGTRIEPATATRSEPMAFSQQTDYQALGERRSARAPSLCSHRSTASAIARIKQAEFDAEERLVELRRRELKMQEELVKKKLALEVAAIREETDRESVNEPETDRRVQDWLQYSHPRGERLEPDTEPETQYPNTPTVRDRSNEPIRPNRVTFEETPARQKGSKIDRLAEALEKLSHSRAPPRQSQELPIFSGDPKEWLPFKAAMRDSTDLYKFSQAENLARLRTCLRGEARQAVSALLYTASGPATIMQTLEQSYGRPEMIIDNALDEIRKLPRPGTTASELNGFAVKLQNIVTIISALDERGYLMNPMLARSVTDKLSPYIKSRWCDYAEEFGSRVEPEIVTLSKFLMREADRAMKYAYTTSPWAPRPTPNVPITKATYDNRKVDKNRKPVFNVTNEYRNDRNDRNEHRNEYRSECFCCGSKHRTTECEKFVAMPLRQKWDWAKEARVCFQCLNGKHRRLTCKGKRCGVNECRQPHHALLHTPRQSETAIGSSEKVESVTSASAHIPTYGTQVLLKVCPITIQGRNGRSVRTHALLDEGSTVTLIDEELAAKVGARGPARALNIVGVTSSQQEPNSRIVRLKIRGQDNRVQTINAHTVKNLTLGKQTVHTDMLKLPHLNELRPDFVCYDEAKPRLLIGADNWHLIVTRKLLTGKSRQPAASLTQLGWIVHGSVPRSNIMRGETVLHLRTSQQVNAERIQADERLENAVKAHYDIDALGVCTKKKVKPADERAISTFKNTVRRVEGRYEVGLPWISDDVTMPPNYDMALCRLRSIERKLDRSAELKAAYTDQINGLLEKGYAEKATDENINSKRLWFLPHFAVTNPNKPGKVRIVFDAAARANGTCLNDMLLDGPDLLQSLCGILYGFRAKQVAITADIREMFLRIKIRSEDRVAQHFLWRGDSRTEPPQKYVMTSMIFGARSSPFLAHSVRNENATEYKTTHPLAYDAITNKHYMDDWIDSFDSQEIAAKTISEVIHVHKQAGFELASWSTSHEELLRNIPVENRSHAPKEIASNAHPYDKALGTLWLSTSDEIAFNTQMNRVSTDVKNQFRIPTKREALGAVMSLFDPLGLLSPYTIAAKIALQELWRKKVEWDDPLPAEEATSFAEWQSDLSFIADIRLPRCYDTRENITDRQLHIFCDASEQAYATVAYWRISDDERVNVTIVAGKAKVAPLKSQSIPRMELQAALIGSRLAADIVKRHPWNNVKVTFWTDSKTVLHWIRNDAQRYTPYVAHRLSEIADLTHPEQWRWVPSRDNVADDATRAGHTQLTNESRWFSGPSFLKEAKEAWPVEQNTETSRGQVMAARAESEQPIINVNRFSTYERLIRALAYVFLFIDKCRKRANKLSLCHIDKSEQAVVRIAQSESFPAELHRLKNSNAVDRSSRLYNLDPIYGSDGIIRLNSRINAASVPGENRNPPILDGAHCVTKLILRREHVKNNHAGREQIVNNVRQKYWVLRLRPSVRGIIKRCASCKAKRASPSEPIKGNLPAARLDAYTRPFSNCGIDCYGPMWVTIGRRREKRWGMLFTCLVTRAIHIELIASLGTDSAIMALRRMGARRGTPKLIISDNGTNFHGSDVELKNAYEEWLPELSSYMLEKRIEWRFIDPGAPNQGGAWERLIKSVKNALLVTLNDRAPKEEVLATLTAEIEYTVNSRPLTHVPVNHDDPEALTPNHFLLGSGIGLPVVGNCDAADRRAWRAAQALANSFWSRWIKEYLPTLAPRGDRQRKSHSNLKIGNVVVIADGLLPRNVWPRGIIEKAYTGPDGVVRSVDVRTKGGVFRRPARRLIVLPTEGEGCEDLRRGETVADNEPDLDK